jgi:hypothetical protein
MPVKIRPHVGTALAARRASQDSRMSSRHDRNRISSDF